MKNNKDLCYFLGIRLIPFLSFRLLSFGYTKQVLLLSSCLAMKRSKPVRLKYSGVTLIELMVIIAVIGVLSSLAVPSFIEQMQQQRVEGAAEGLVAAMQNAKAEAIKTNNDIKIVFTSSGGICTGSTCSNTSNAHLDWCYGMTNKSTCNCTLSNSCATGSEVQGTDYSNVSVTFNTSKSRNFDSMKGAATSGTIRFFSGTRSLGVTTSSLGRIRICKDTNSTLSSYQDSGVCP